MRLLGYVGERMWVGRERQRGVVWGEFEGWEGWAMQEKAGEVNRNKRRFENPEAGIGSEFLNSLFCKRRRELFSDLGIQAGSWYQYICSN